MPCAAFSSQVFTNAILTALTGQHLLSLSSWFSHQLFQKSSLALSTPNRWGTPPMCTMYLAGIAHSTHCPVIESFMFCVFFFLSVSSQKAEIIFSSVAYVTPSVCRATRPLQMLNMFCWMTGWYTGREGKLDRIRQWCPRPQMSSSMSSLREGQLQIP